MKTFFFGSNKGTTLVELLVALPLIALVILGGGMFFFYGRVNIVQEAHRRVALLVTSQRMEELKAANWEDIAPEDGDTSDGYTFDSSSPYYLLGSASWSWIQPSTLEDDPPEDAEETVTVDNLSDAKMVTEAKYVADDGGSSDDYLKITVTVEWSDSTTSTVSLATLIAPH